MNKRSGTSKDAADKLVTSGNGTSASYRLPSQLNPLAARIGGSPITSCFSLTNPPPGCFLNHLALSGDT